MQVFLAITEVPTHFDLVDRLVRWATLALSVLAHTAVIVYTFASHLRWIGAIALVYAASIALHSWPASHQLGD